MAILWIYKMAIIKYIKLFIVEKELHRASR